MTAAETTMTPAGLQRLAQVARRRRIALALNLAVYAGLSAWLARILAAGGWSALDIAFFACFLVASPWATLGFVNALLGLWLLRFSRDGLDAAAPFAFAGEGGGALEGRYALVMTVRNEDATRAVGRFMRMEAELAATSQAGRFSYHLLSDTSQESVAAAEAREIERWRAARPEVAARVHYRRRADNSGFKAGNLREFCARCVDDYDAMIVLDADSYMRASAVLQLCRIAEDFPKIGILQSLVVGAPSRSAFARLFQFGMRAGMRSYTMGASWWTADCGPFWGHNALVRIKPFLDHCDLPTIGGRPILSHDQLEAALMRAAGYEVRVLPLENGSFEENPPDMVEFSNRDLRWCQGNMQYWRLVGLPRILPVSRFQLFWAISMFVGLPASQLMLMLAALKPFDGEPLAAFPFSSALAFYFAYLAIGLAPKLAGYADVALARETARYGGAGRFAMGAAMELAASYLLSAATAFRTSLFLIGLPFGRDLSWGGQRRDAHDVSWMAAAAPFWPGTLFGLALVATLALGAPAAIPYALPFVAGLIVAIPFAKFTAAPGLGETMARAGLCATPEEAAGDWPLASGHDDEKHEGREDRQVYDAL
ncbi:MAG TPA: glucans biosynthesis glucosyltransferase MdoH [Rhodoblastus sp.]|nr:glucans biosynthesis glucosyltransferase MdoH [Rhodoblastus sp.]